MLIPVLLSAVLAAPSFAPDPIKTNDNRVGAGVLRDNVLTLHLEAKVGVWYPEGTDAKPRTVAAFAEVGKQLLNPGPMIRVREGTVVRVFVHNNLDKELKMFGLGKARGADADSFAITPGGMKQVEFVADKRGTYYYAGKTDTQQPLFNRKQLDSQLNGAIIVDGPNDKKDDRVFLISWWYDGDKSAPSNLLAGSLISINGLAWPHSETVQAKQGDHLNFRWINVTIVPHPMHLHGFYFTVTGQGDGASFKQLSADEQFQTVTEPVFPGNTMSMSFTPSRPGNWIMHCHFAGHITTVEAMNRSKKYPEDEHAEHDMPMHTMHGLVMGIQVAPTTYAKASYENARPIRLLVRSKARVYGDNAGFSFVLGDSPAAADPQGFTVPGPTLVLKKDQPVAITIVNQSHEPAAIHWHGIELESFPDGVPLWSGEGSQVLKSIMPRDSFTVRFIPPRAGTFMYHSHSNEQQQISSGLYGMIVVTDEKHPYNPETDRTFLFSDNGPSIDQLDGPFPEPMLNGSVHPDAMELKTGVTYRFRFVNIRPDGIIDAKLVDGDAPVTWKEVAVDGMDLPVTKVKAAAAELSFTAGQIRDYEFTPTRAGTLTLNYQEPSGPPGSPPPIVHTMKLIVR